jgi:hypothetical protein
LSPASPVLRGEKRHRTAEPGAHLFIRGGGLAKQQALQVPIAKSPHRPLAATDGFKQGAVRGAERMQSTKQELKEAVHKYFTGEDYEPYEMVYLKLFESQLRLVERALYGCPHLRRRQGACPLLRLPLLALDCVLALESFWL